jgi:hypothetical protein
LQQSKRLIVTLLHAKFCITKVFLRSRFVSLRSDCYSDLISSIDDLTAIGSSVWIAYTKRVVSTELLFFNQLVKSFHLRVVDESELEPEFRERNHTIVIATKTELNTGAALPAEIEAALSRFDLVVGAAW